MEPNLFQFNFVISPFTGPTQADDLYGVLLFLVIRKKAQLSLKNCALSLFTSSYCHRGIPKEDILYKMYCTL